MSDLSWHAALAWSAVGSGLTLIVMGTWKRRKPRNKRIGLPAPACQRFPDWTAATSMLTRRQDNFDHR